MVDELIGARYFPPPVREIFERIPEALRVLFGNEEEPQLEDISDRIDYVCRAERPDKSLAEVLLYREYALSGGLPIAFVIGDHLDLSGVAAKIVDYRAEHARPRSTGSGITYWRVMVTTLEEEEHDG